MSLPQVPGPQRTEVEPSQWRMEQGENLPRTISVNAIQTRLPVLGAPLSSLPSFSAIANERCASRNSSGQLCTQSTGDDRNSSGPGQPLVGNNLSNAAVLRMMGKMRSDIAVLVQVQTQVVAVLKKHHEENMSMQAKALHLLASVLGDTLGLSETATESKIASMYLTLLLYLELLKPSGTDLYHLGAHGSDKILQQAVRCAIGRNSSDEQVRGFMEKKLSIDVNNKSKKMAIGRILLRQRSRAYNIVREEAVKLFRAHAPQESGLNIAVTDEVAYREACIYFSEHSELLKGPCFYQSWTQACFGAAQICRRKAKSLVSQITAETGHNEVMVDVSILDEPPESRYSAGMLAFVKIKIQHTVAKTAGLLNSVEIQKSHGEMWARELLEITAAVENQDANDQTRSCCGVRLFRNPPESDLRRLAMMLGSNSAGNGENEDAHMQAELNA